MDVLKLMKPYPKRVQIQKDNFHKCINHLGLGGDLLELALASLDGQASDGKALPTRKRVTKVRTFTKVGTFARAHGQDIK